MKKKTKTEQKQETESQGDHSEGIHFLSPPEAQPEQPEINIEKILQNQDKRIEAMEKSQTDLLKYLQEKFKSEGQQTQGDGTLGQLAGIAQTIMKEDKPPTTDERLSALALDNMSLMNRFMLKKLLGEDVESTESSHRTV